MDEEALSASLRKYLKKVGITAQREIESAIRQAVKDGRLDGDERLDLVVNLAIPTIDLEITVDGEIDLE